MAPPFRNDILKSALPSQPPDKRRAANQANNNTLGIASIDNRGNVYQYNIFFFNGVGKLNTFMT